MPSARWQLTRSAEDRKQLYWGAFMLGCAAFHARRRAGDCLSSEAVERLAREQFDAILAATSDGLPYVDDPILGQVHFVIAFVAGYRQRAEHTSA